MHDIRATGFFHTECCVFQQPQQNSVGTTKEGGDPHSFTSARASDAPSLSQSPVDSSDRPIISGGDAAGAKSYDPFHQCTSLDITVEELVEDLCKSHHDLSQHFISHKSRTVRDAAAMLVRKNIARQANKVVSWCDGGRGSRSLPEGMGEIFGKGFAQFDSFHHAADAAATCASSDVPPGTDLVAHRQQWPQHLPPVDP